MKYIMCSRSFPKGHPKEGQPTWFVEKILNCFRENFRLPDSFKPWVDNYVMLLQGEEYLNSMGVREVKHHTIRAGNRFKPGDMASLRVWADKPYRSKQIEFAQVEVKRVWDIEINVIQTSPVLLIEGKQLTYDAGRVLAENDGLTLTDFISWFNIHPKKKQQKFTGQIICWSDKIEYGKPDLQKLKAIG